jgi:hypothetical protein
MSPGESRAMPTEGELLAGLEQNALVVGNTRYTIPR